MKGDQELGRLTAALLPFNHLITLDGLAQGQFRDRVAMSGTNDFHIVTDRKQVCNTVEVFFWGRTLKDRVGAG